MGVEIWEWQYYFCNRYSLRRRFVRPYPEIPWKDIAGMRDILAHQYDRINLSTLWDVIQTDIPELLTVLELLLPDSILEVNNE